ncbi:hypothetical protein PVAND_017480 [Polypedilum vanderplanki]|uniref:Sulfotransferase domain-containing protein n=1 Tax=Polypedilum vanderplanki TaxID=319348 RepID=A0A9J6BI77_POLVA|nr:hypothetical protein PVAND_017480 [Polypedilum vanderplanki]
MTSKLDLFYPFKTVKAEGEKWKNFPSCVLFNIQEQNLDRIKREKIYPDDVFLCGFQRSGTTMMQEIIWLILNDFDFEKSKTELKDLRFPTLESIEMVEKVYNNKIKINMDSMQRPRTIKTHLPVQLLPDEFWISRPKIIFLTRDIRDVAISCFNVGLKLLAYKSSMEEFLQEFLDDKLPLCPYREHTLDYMNIPDYPNRLNLTYEWVNANIDEAILKIAKFLGKEVSDENLKLLKDHVEIANMKKIDTINRREFFENITDKSKPEEFIRKGKVENYKEEMPQEFHEKFDAWMEEIKKMKSSFEL